MELQPDACATTTPRPKRGIEAARPTSCTFLGELLGNYDEEDAENRLIDAVSKSSHVSGLYRKLNVAWSVASEYMREAQNLGRYEEVVAVGTECLESAKIHYGDSSEPTQLERKHNSLEMLAYACVMTGRFDESKRAFDELAASATRFFGHEHEQTQKIFMKRALVLNLILNKAEDLAVRDDIANAARHLDAVLIEARRAIFSTRRTRMFRSITRIWPRPPLS